MHLPRNFRSFKLNVDNVNNILKRRTKKLSSKLFIQTISPKNATGRSELSNITTFFWDTQNGS